MFTFNNWQNYINNHPTMARSSAFLSRIHKTAAEKNTHDTYATYAAEAGVFLLCSDPTL